MKFFGDVLELISFIKPLFSWNIIDDDFMEAKLFGISRLNDHSTFDAFGGNNVMSVLFKFLFVRCIFLFEIHYLAYWFFAVVF